MHIQFYYFHVDRHTWPSSPWINKYFLFSVPIINLGKTSVILIKNIKYELKKNIKLDS